MTTETHAIKVHTLLTMAEWQIFRHTKPSCLPNNDNKHLLQVLS